MATIVEGSIIQSRFIGSPISVPVTASSPAGNVAFHRVRLKVTANDGASVITTGASEFEFSIPCSNGETVWFDISSAFRAFADSYNPAPATYSYPHLSANIEAVEDYMIDGVSYEGQGSSGIKAVSGKYLGALSDKERGYGISNSWSEPSRYSRKPTSSPEICFYHPGVQGQSDGTAKYLSAGATTTDTTPVAPAVTAISVPAGFPTGQNPPNIYGIPYPPDGHEIRFINSLGVHENVFVAGLPTKDVNITTEKYTIARQETLTKFSRGLTVKQNDYETWTLSSGPLDEAWASWYIHEFLMARWAWIEVSGAWVPCHILPEETVSLLDSPSAKMLEVQFKIQLDINGSPV